MQPGRLVKVNYRNHDFGWGAVVNYQKRFREDVGHITLICIGKG